MPFEGEYSRLFSRLGVQLEPGDGFGREELLAAEQRLAAPIPEALHAYYRIAGRETQFNQAHNRLMPPDDWFVDAGHLVFLEENQNVVFWGVPTTPRTDDPPVEQGVNGDTLEWHAEHHQCSIFLRVMLVWQATMGGFGRTWSARVAPDFPDALQDWLALGTINELHAYCRDRLALCFLPWSDGPRIFASGEKPDDLESLAGRLGIEWDADHDHWRRPGSHPLAADSRAPEAGNVGQT